MKLRCLVIDDEPLAVELMESYVRKTPFLSLAGSCGSGTAAFAMLREQPVDLLFCDIQMPGLNGMELSRMLPEATRVIFTTAFSQYAVEGFRSRPSTTCSSRSATRTSSRRRTRRSWWFELKHRAEEAERSERTDSTPKEPVRRPDESPQSIFVKTEYRLQQIDLDRICYIEGLKDYVKIHVEGETHPVVSLLSLKALEEQLPADRFIRVHRSYIVQPSKIRTIERNRIPSSGRNAFRFRRTTGRPSTTSWRGIRCFRRISRVKNRVAENQSCLR